MESDRVVGIVRFALGKVAHGKVKPNALNTGGGLGACEINSEFDTIK